MMKNARQTAILSLIEQYDIETQEELAGKLREMGIVVTQATVKVLSGKGGYKYATADKAEHGLTDRFVRMFKESVLNIAYASNIIVIKTLSGSANVAAEAIDSMRLPEILGTMAGDNTVLAIVQNEQEAEKAVNGFREMLK